MDTKLEEIKALIKDSNRIVFVGGAGVSTASGIPDFRSPAGLYKIHSEYGVSYETMLSHTYFEYHTETFYDFYWKTMVAKNAKPNKAHIALANYEKAGHHIAIITQNIDGLHQEAGSKRVYEVHGSTKRYNCVDCGRHYDIGDIPNIGIPHCPECGGVIKPDVVLYEEPLNEDVVESALTELRFANFLIVGGTSLNVYPAAGMIDYFQGGHTLLINKEPTPRDSFFEYVIYDDIGKVLEELLS